MAGLPVKAPALGPPHRSPGPQGDEERQSSVLTLLQHGARATFSPGVPDYQIDDCTNVADGNCCQAAI